MLMSLITGLIAASSNPEKIDETLTAFFFLVLLTGAPTLMLWTCCLTRSSRECTPLNQMQSSLLLDGIPLRHLSNWQIRRPVQNCTRTLQMFGHILPDAG